MLKEKIVEINCCISFATMPMLSSQIRHNDVQLEIKTFELSNTTQTVATYLNDLTKENISISQKVFMKELEDLFGQMSNFSKEENEHFWNRIKQKSTVIEGIKLV